MQTRARYRCENLLKSQNGLCSDFSEAKYLEGGERPVFQKTETPAYITHPQVIGSIRSLTVSQSTQRYDRLLNKDPPDVFVKGRLAYCQVSPSSRCLLSTTTDFDAHGC